jgi:hypothetical protein
MAAGTGNATGEATQRQSNPITLINPPEHTRRGRKENGMTLLPKKVMSDPIVQALFGGVFAAVVEVVVAKLAPAGLPQLVTPLTVGGVGLYLAKKQPSWAGAGQGMLGAAATQLIAPPVKRLLGVDPSVLSGPNASGLDYTGMSPYSGALDYTGVSPYVGEYQEADIVDPY